MMSIKRFHIWIDAHRPKRGELHTLGDKAIYELETIADALDREITTLRGTTIEQIQELMKLAEEIDELKEENEKLHELMQSMYYDLAHQTFAPDWIGEYEEDMRKLGIEVE